MPKTSSILLVVSIQYQLVTDRQTDRQTDGQMGRHSKYGAVIASLATGVLLTAVVMTALS